MAIKEKPKAKKPKSATLIQKSKRINTDCGGVECGSPTCCSCESEKSKECEDSCKSCGVVWNDHLGISGTCAKLEKARKSLAKISKMSSNFSYDDIRKLCDKTLEAIK